MCPSCRLHLPLPGTSEPAPKRRNNSPAVVAGSARPRCLQRIPQGIATVWAGGGWSWRAVSRKPEARRSPMEVAI
jgi:hypothetical protein